VPSSGYQLQARLCPSEFTVRRQPGRRQTWQCRATNKLTNRPLPKPRPLFSSKIKANLLLPPLACSAPNRTSAQSEFRWTHTHITAGICIAVVCVLRSCKLCGHISLRLAFPRAPSERSGSLFNIAVSVLW
jgi:hypothetical protein